jgi:hypothetical protein
MHFLMKLYQTPEIKDPVKNAPDVHKHFTRYSKGRFDGPIVKISVSAGKITIGSSFEYEDALFRLALEQFQDESVNVKGTLLSGSDFTADLDRLGFGKDWHPEKSTGQTKNYTTAFKTETTVKKAQLDKAAAEWPNYLYALLTFSSASKTVSLATKPKPPRPNSKNPEDSNPANLIKFCTLKMPFSDNAWKAVIEALALDFKDEIPVKVKSITITNVYEITDVMIPKEKLPSEQLRLQTLRKGIIHRMADVDGKNFKNDIQFTA